MSAEEAETAKIEVVHNQIALFETPWYRIQVTPDNFDVTAAGRPFAELVRDLAYGTFSVLRHTPMTMLGMNNFQHFQTKSEDTWHDIGHRFAPKDFWADLLREPGMQSLVIRGRRPDEWVGWVDVRVEPSLVVRPNGVFVHVNDHVQLDDREAPEGALKLMNVLQESWGSASERAAIVIEAVKALAQ
jgi:hypothetical protein